MFNQNMTKKVHILIDEYIEEREDELGIAVDATLGNGHDLLFLLEKLGEKSTLVGIDIQEEAIENTKQRICDKKGKLPQNTIFIKRSHEDMKEIVEEAKLRRGDKESGVDLIMFNLGYLPTGNKAITTMTDSSLRAINASLEVLHTKGLLSVVLYPGHEEGKKETEQILSYLEQLPSNKFEVIMIKLLNRNPLSPISCFVFKR